MKPILISDLGLSFSHKTCFEHFSTQIQFGDRIAIIGRNGAGKSTLLQILNGSFNSFEGTFSLLQDIGYIPQIIEEFDTLSGGERFNEALTQVLSQDPKILLLDEPTNHLDRNNRKSLIRKLKNYSGTLIVVSHDTELLRECTDILWHIDNGKIHIFSGKYDDYIHEIKLKRTSIEGELNFLSRQKRDVHNKLMQEQQRASKSKSKGEKSIDQNKWPTVVSKSKALRGEETSGRKKSAIDQKKQEMLDQLENLRLPEIIIPKFSISSQAIGNRVLIQIRDGRVGWTDGKWIVSNINFEVTGQDRIGITGRNGSGKSTLLKAILGDLFREGEWFLPKKEDIGYLDQHYSTLDNQKTVLEVITEVIPVIPEARCHLNDFLFRKNEEVNTYVSALSGGERARLSLALIAAKTPKVLILDEITNNLDLETKEHVIQVLKEYPGALIVVSHDNDFLEAIGIINTVAI